MLALVMNHRIKITVSMLLYNKITFSECCASSQAGTPSARAVLAGEGQQEGAVGGPPQPGASCARDVPAGEGQEEQEEGEVVLEVVLEEVIVQEADSTFDDRDGSEDLPVPYQGVAPLAQDDESDFDDDSFDSDDRVIPW